VRRPPERQSYDGFLANIVAVVWNSDPVRAKGRAGLPTTILLVCLLAAAAIGIPAILLAGKDLHAEKEIAGHYQVSVGADCVGHTFDLHQSGQFVSLSRSGGDRIARLRLRDGDLTGDVTCIDGSTLALQGHAEGRDVGGTLGAATLVATRIAQFDEATAAVPTNTSSVDGSYVLSPESVCLGRTFSLNGGSRPALTIDGGVPANLTYEHGELRGPVRCIDGDRAQLTGVASGDRLEIEVARDRPGPGEQRIEQGVAETKQSLSDQTASFFLAVIVILLAARLAGGAALRLGQVRVMGEIIAGILLGPTLFGALAPNLQADLFSAHVLPALGVVANLGLIVYVFLIGIELDVAAMRQRAGGVLVTALAAFVVPLLLGSASALLIYELLSPDIAFAPFALFLGISMSITAFPVLARILEERKLLGGAIGSTALAAAAIDDLLGWLLITVATALAVSSGTAGDVLPTLGWTALFAVVTFGLVRPLLRRAAALYERSRAGVWVTAVLVGALLSAYVTEKIGIALIIGAVAMGAAMPKRAALTADVRANSETFVTLLLLPLFFAYTGLRTDVTGLGQGELWLLAALLLAIAITGKLVAVTLAGRISGMSWRLSGTLGALMNTRGLTELIVLNLALEIGVISEALFTALVLMALVTTFMTVPLLRLIGPVRESEHGAAG
jgi:Kef-type K+ transport system membrane component KefB